MRKTQLWAGLSATMSSILIIALCAALIANQFAADLNSYLNIKTTQVIGGSTENVDTIYYKSEFGEFTSENLEKLDLAMFELARDEMREGAVLLRNENHALPLADSERKVTLFGNATHNPLYRTYSAGSDLCNDPAWTTDLKEALEGEAFLINSILWDAYTADADATGKRPQDKRGKGGNANNTEHPIGFYSKYSDSFENYHDVAIISIARQGGEGVDMNTWEDDDLGSPNYEAGIRISSLALHQNERDMLDLVSKAGFGKIIVLINSPYALELDWFDEYNVDAALWISTPGSVGFEGVAEILVGKVNPSGLLTDVWAADTHSAPAMANSNGNTPMWANADQLHDSGIITIGQGASVWDSLANIQYVNVQQENIYVGYKYYETRYADVVMNQGNASSTTGAFKSKGNSWNYADEVCYTLGYGLSYTEFDQAITQVIFDVASDSYEVTINIKNIGQTPGKRAVVVYAQTPYGKYEQSNDVEKSAIQPVGYTKTKVLAPDESEIVTINVDRYMLASYDSHLAEGYILSGGDYYFAVGNGAHEALNNILAAQGYENLIDHEGDKYQGNALAVVKVMDGLPSENANPDTNSYAYSKATGERVTNQFASADYNYWEEDTGITVKYLSRSDWSGTFPVEAASVTLKGSRMENLLEGNVYVKSDNAPKADSFAFSVDHGIPFARMMSVDYNDQEMWDQFIEQLSLRELCSLFRLQGSSDTVNKPDIANGDGCDSAGNLPGAGNPLGYGTNQVENTYNPGRGSVVFTSLMAATYNPELQRRRGELMGEMWLYSKVFTACTGGGNIRRTPFSGRNAEYYTEDSNLNSLIGSIEFTGMMSKGVNGGPKHFATNDMEFQRMSICVFTTEQALRENSLRSFEYDLRSDKAGALYVMTCNFRVGLVWTLCNRAVQIDVLRNEWGFHGLTNADCSLVWPSGYTSNHVDILMSGHDSSYSLNNDISIDNLENYVLTSNDGDAVLRLRERAKNMYYCWSHSGATNGLSPDATIVRVTPIWQTLTWVGVGVLSAMTLAAFVMFILSKYRWNKKEV